MRQTPLWRTVSAGPSPSGAVPTSADSMPGPDGPGAAPAAAPGGRVAGLARAGWSFLRDLARDPRGRVYLVLLVLSLAVGPVALAKASTVIYAGIATPTPTLYTYTVATVVTAAVMVRAGRRLFLGALLPWAPFFAWLLALGLFTWNLSPLTLSGTLHLCLGAVSFAIGVTAHRLDRAGAVLPWTFLVAAWIQLLAIVLAVLGFPLRRITGPQALDVLGRATGLTSHPGELAKVLFFCGMCTLALPQHNRRERWAAWLTLGAVLAGVSLAESRSVLAAVVSMVVVFVLLELAAGRWQRKHFVMIGIVLALGAVSAPWLVQRFSADPNGGARDHVTLVAERVIRDHPWTGVGPNAYVAVAGQFDRLTQTGVPVHNIFLLSAAELGVVGAACLWLPFAVIALRAIRRVWRSRGTDVGARLIVSALPGLGLIAVTGWGLLQGQGFLMLCLIFGYFGASVGTDRSMNADGRD